MRTGFRLLLPLGLLILAACAHHGAIDSNGDPPLLSNQIDSAAQQTGEDPALQRLVDRARTARTQWGRQSAARRLTQQGVARYQEGKYSAAIASIEAAVVIQQQIGDQHGRVKNLNNLARLHNLIGDHETALQRLQEALPQARALDSPGLTASSLINLGNIQLNLRNYQHAIDYLQRALQLDLDSQPALRAEAYTVMGAVYRQQSDFEQALDYYQRALAIYTALRSDAGIAASQRILGELHLHRVAGKRAQNLAQARTYLRQALEGHRQQNDRLGAAMASSHLAEHAYAGQDFDSAITLYQEALDYFEQVTFNDGRGRMHVHLGFAQGEAGRLVLALQHFNQAIDIYERLQDREWLRVALFGRGWILEQQGDSSAAETSYKRAVELFESIRLGVAGDETARALFTRVNRRIYENLIVLLVARGDVEEALEYVERSRLKSLRDSLFTTRRTTPVTRSGNELTELTRLSRKRAHLADTLKYARDDDARARITETLAENERQAVKLIYQLGKQYRGIENTLNIIPNTRQFRHSTSFPADLAIITYFVTDEALLVFVVKKDRQVVVKRVAISSQALSRQVAKAITLINRSQSDTAAEVSRLRQQLKQLYAVLIEPIEASLTEINTLAILPVKWLGFLPFEALLTTTSAEAETHLLASKQILYLSAISYADQLYSLTHDPLPPQIKDIVAFGNPTVDQQVESLPFAELEVGEIARLFEGSTIFTRDDASKENFAAHWAKHQLIHIAAHTRLIDGQAEILLAPADHGTLQMGELFDLPRNETTRFMVLSSCQTALDPELALLIWQNQEAKSIASAPLTSVAHTLLLVGIPSVLATLWEIDDQATALMMKGFYSHLKQGKGPYQALRAVQLEMSRRQDRYSQPYYWSGFVFYGAGL